QRFGGAQGFRDIFDMFFGGGARQAPNAPRQGNDLQYTMTLTFEEAIFGKETEINIPKEEKCDTCDGSGAKKGTNPETCPYCNGSGKTDVKQDTPCGRIINRRACNHCGGTGQLIKVKCETCIGSVLIKKDVTIKISIHESIVD